MRSLRNRLKRLEKNEWVYLEWSHCEVIAKANRLRLIELGPDPDLERRLAELHDEIASRMKKGVSIDNIAALWAGDEALQRAFFAGVHERLSASPRLGIWIRKKKIGPILDHLEWSKEYLQNHGAGGAN